MSFKRKTWKDGEKISASELNRIEQGIASAANVQPDSLAIEGPDIDDFKVITTLFNNYSVAFYSANGYGHAPFEYGLIITHDNPCNAVLDGPEYEQVGFSLEGATKGKIYARTVRYNDISGEYEPAADDWGETAHAMDYKGEVETLPDAAQFGDVYMVTQEHSVSTGKLSITVDGVRSITADSSGTVLDIDTDSGIYKFFKYAYKGLYGQTADGSTFSSYLQKYTTVYAIPWISTTNYGTEGDDILISDTPENVAPYLINGTVLTCWADDMSALPDDLKRYLVYKIYAAGSYFMWDGSAWRVLAEAFPASAAIPRLVTTAGTGKDYTATLEGYTRYATGDTFVVLPHTNSTNTAPTLNINGLGAKAIKRKSGTGTTAALSIASALKYNTPFMAVYNGTEFVIQDAQPYGGEDFATAVSISKGGTGRGSWAANRLPYPASATNFQQLPFPTSKSFLAQEGSGAPFWVPESELGGGGSSSGNVKKIGYTDDCDYIVVSASSALSVFRTAISETAPGDTLIIMPGTYSGSGTLSIEKNLNFIGIGKVILTFSVLTACEYYFDEQNYTFVTTGQYTTHWSGITFAGGFSVGGEDGPGEAAQSYANCINCHFSANDIKLSGRYQNCSFVVDDVITCGQYYGNGATFYNCSIKCGAFGTGANDFYNCNIYFSESTTNYNTFGGGGYLYNCNLYLYRSGIDGSNDHGYDTCFNKCNFFGYPIVNNYTAFTQCFQYVGTEL